MWTEPPLSETTVTRLRSEAIEPEIGNRQIFLKISKILCLKNGRHVIIYIECSCSIFFSQVFLDLETVANKKNGSKLLG